MQNHAAMAAHLSDATCTVHTRAFVVPAYSASRAVGTHAPSWQLALGGTMLAGHTCALVAAHPHWQHTLVPSGNSPVTIEHAAGLAPSCPRGSSPSATVHSTCIMHTRALVAARPRQYHRHHAPSCPHGSSLAGCHMCCAHAYPCDGSPSAIARASCTLVPSWQLACGRALVGALSR